MQLRAARCSNCALSVPCESVDGVHLVRCVVRNVRKNPKDCCVKYLAPSAGYDYPKGSWRDVGGERFEQLSNAQEFVFSPSLGLVPRTKMVRK